MLTRRRRRGHWPKYAARPAFRAAIRGLFLHVEELEPRVVPDAGGALAVPLVNQAITTDPGVQQMPSVAVDLHDSRHVVIAYMDYALVTTGYAGIGVAVSPTPRLPRTRACSRCRRSPPTRTTLTTSWSPTWITPS